MKLIEIQNCDLKRCYELFQSFEASENGFENDAYGMNLDEFKAFVQKCVLESQGIGLPEWKVPQTVYILEDENQLVGIFKLRHYLTEALANGAGHIGYGVAKNFRHQGYGKKGLALTVEKAIERGIEEIYISCYKTNQYSRKVQEANGFILHHEDEREYYLRKKVKK